MIRKGRHYSPEEIFPKVEFTTVEALLLRGGRRDLDGDLINFSSSRLQTFAKKGIVCARCGTIGEFFIKEKHHEREPYFHLAFYAIDGNGNWILMTKDHIIPKSKGGKDCLDNFQPMCRICNEDKGSDPWNQ
jgi:hypothetical protein